MADIDEVYSELREAVVEQRERLDGIEKRGADAVTRDEVARLDNAITGLQAQLEAMQSPQVAVPALGGGEDDDRRRQFRDLVSGRVGIAEIRAAATTYIGPDGGYLVPQEVDTAVSRFLSTTSAMRRICRVVTISTGTYNAYTTVEGAAARWSAENGPGGETDTPKLVEISIRTGKLEAEPAATIELLQDASVNVEAWLASEIAAAFAEREGEAFITGDGVDKPRGLTTYPTAANSPNLPWGTFGHVNTGVNGAFPATNPGDVLVDVFYALKDGYRVNGTWIASDPVLAAIRKFKTSTGEYLWQPPISADSPPTILGRPVVTDNFMPAPGTGTLSVAFGDFSAAYTIVDRTGIQVMPNPYRRAGVVFLMAYKRVGGNVTRFEAAKFVRFSA